MPRRLNLDVSAELDREWSEMARDCGLEKGDILVRGLAVMKAFSESRRDGLMHLGFTSDPARLDRRVVNVLPDRKPDPAAETMVFTSRRGKAVGGQGAS